METAGQITRRRTTFRFRQDLLERLKENARETNHSLNSYIEMLLMDAVCCLPNAETIAAFEEAKAGVGLESIDLEHFDAFVASLE
ncbi:toxin-antitoxin system protein [Hoylesella pleuritidis]|uniref:toxin-antitoxin system protein n=1 Tax=Hoylesella pleuritidis TaxID=407975 RepID=UPI0028D25F3A|nr:toxin-antitoxin system protein [Hoylesella pleuritidis]